MDSFQDIQRQLRIAFIGICITLFVGTSGYMLIEGKPFLNAFWLTVITLTTVGYGDDYARSDGGRIFTIFLILFGFGVVAYGLQATATLLVSPQIREFRERRRTEKTICNMERHYIICGHGELVNQTITYLLQSVHMSRIFNDEAIYAPIDTFLDGIFGDDELGHYPRARAFVRSLYLLFTRPFSRVGTLLDVVVVVTADTTYAATLRNGGFLVIEGNPTHDEILTKAGVADAAAMMVMLPNDTDALLTVLTARSHNRNLYITAATIDEELEQKTLKVGANNVIQPHELSGQFLNNVTLRPTVYDFFHGVLFDETLNIQTTQITIAAESQWVGKRLADLNLKGQHQAHLLGIHQPDGETFIVTPSNSFTLSAKESLIIAAPASSIAHLNYLAQGTTKSKRKRTLAWQAPRLRPPVKRADTAYTLDEAEAAIASMSKHFIVCGNDNVAHHAARLLDPTRPFVIVSNDDKMTDHLLERGFRVIHGDPTDENTLIRARANHALATMISLNNEADTVLTVINARSLSTHLLITATANSDEHIHKITQAGADRVINPFSIAAQFVLLSTTRPLVSQFFKHVLYNPESGLETTEIYMEDSCVWIGKTIADLHLDHLFQAHVLGVRHPNGTFEYAPPNDYQIKNHDVLIIVTPMAHADELRVTAHGNLSKRPETLRRANTPTLNR